MIARYNYVSYLGEASFEASPENGTWVTYEDHAAFLNNLERLFSRHIDVCPGLAHLTDRERGFIKEHLTFAIEGIPPVCNPKEAKKDEKHIL